IAWIVRRLTASSAAALAAAAVFALNPNVLYLQATPMTEPLLVALTTVAIALLVGDARPAITGTVLALACLTRYEAWPLTCAALAIAVFVRWRESETPVEFIEFIGACRAVARIALYPFVAVVGFAIFSRVVIGEWFVASGFFVPENKAQGDLMLAMKEIAW